MVKAITALDADTLRVFAYLTCIDRSRVTRVRFAEVSVGELHSLGADLGLTPVQFLEALTLLLDLGMLLDMDDEEWAEAIGEAYADATGAVS
jgi:hypothetical protein